MSPGFLPFALALVPHPAPLTLRGLATVAVLTCSLTWLYIRLRRHVERPNETDFWWTTLSYPAVVLATLCAFRGAPELAAVVVVALAWGDGSAYLGGKLIGGPRLPWNREKTWAGMLSFVAVAGPAATLAYWCEMRALWRYDSSAVPFSETSVVPWEAAAVCGFGAVVLAAVAESLPTRLTDNLRVGFAAAFAVVVLHYVCVPPLMAGR